MCLLTDTHGHPVCADGHTWTSSTDVLCVLPDSHGQPRTSCVPTTNVLICVLMDRHRRHVCADGHTQTHTYSHRCHVCTYGQPRTSCVPRGPKSPKQSTGRARVLSPSTKVMICVLMDSHGRSVCADGHTRTHMDSHGRHVCADGHTRTQPTWVKITRTVHVRASVLSPRTNVLICVLMDSHICPVCADGHTQTHTDVLCVLTDTDGRPPRTSCVCWRTPTDTHGHTRTATDVLSTNVLCVLADTHGRPVCIEQTAHMGQNHPKSPQEGPSCRVQEPMC
ncbi:unnamed protein product [Brassica rapa]|uniref:Uncharacterized protein n=1 Tax=Brassica campestris TaxID=3711 RepID=A0A8D9CT68_BRACM|nr:unnamed protein product [Brassica rapa]